MPKKTRAPLNIALVGASGRMGQEILSLAQDSDCSVSYELGRSADWSKVDAARVHVVIDFSSPAGLARAITWCERAKVPLVSGSTGLAAKDFAALNRAAKKIPVLYSANMSLGIAVMSAMLGEFTRVEDWDFQIEEAHHSKKKDRPSGTALLLQNRLEQVLDRKLPKPLSRRGGSIPGEHSVMAMGPDEGITIQHTAFNRQVFARGALRAGRWLFDKKAPGLYDLGDLYK